MMRYIQPIITTLFFGICSGIVSAYDIPGGELVKVGVDHTGIFQVTPQQLASMGLGGADEVAVYGYGGVENRNLDPAKDFDGMPEIPAYVTSDGRLVFYAEGPTRLTVYKTSANSTTCYTRIENNSSSKKGYYFLAPSTSPLRMTTAEAAAGSTSLSSHCSPYVYFPQVTNPASSGAHFLGEDISRMPDKEQIFNIPLTDISVSDPWQSGTYIMASKSSQNTFSLQYADNTFNIMTQASSGNLTNPDISYNTTVPKIFATRGAKDNYNIKFSFKKNTNTQYAALGYLTFTYNRLNKIPDNEAPMAMYFYGLNAGNRINISNATEATRVWDVSDCCRPQQLPTTIYGNTLTAIVAEDHPASSSIIAFDPEAAQSPVTIHERVSLGRLHQVATPQLLIITAPAFETYARQLASLHQTYQGMSVEVVTPGEIYNEFGSGTSSPYAIRRFVKFLYDRDKETLRNLLILGAATFDPAGHILGHSLDDTHVITYETEDIYKQGDNSKSYATDAFFTFVDDESCSNAEDITLTMMALNVGRIACLNESQAQSYVAKVEKYLQSPPDVDIHSHAMVIADHGDDGVHLTQALRVCNDIMDLSPHAVVTHAFSALYDRNNNGQMQFRNTVTQALSRGVGFITYSGHANPSAIGSDSFLKRTHVQALVNNDFPLVMLSTCYSVGYDRDESPIGQLFLFNDKGGAIAVIGAGRSVNREYNQLLNRSVTVQQFGNEENIYLGDVFRNARNANCLTYPTNTSLSYNNSCYNFMGDPALPRYIHSHKMAITVPEQGITIHPLERNTIDGVVLDDGGETETSFNGKVILNLYAPAEVALTDYDKNGAAAQEFTRQEKLIATATGEIVNGTFSTSLTCPEVSVTDAGYRILAHAISHNGMDRAVAFADDIEVTELGDSPELVDGTVPVIKSLYIDSESFNDGDIVNPDIQVRATVEPSSSELCMLSSIDRPAYIEIDDKRYCDVNSHFSTSDDGLKTLKYDIEGLADGNHTLSLVVSDNAGNRDKATVHFQVITHSDMKLAVSENTAMTEANISLTHSLTSEPTGRVIIEDSNGETVYTASDVSFPYTWNLTDNDGNDVADGRYTVHAMLRSGSLCSAATPAVITVVK